MSNRHPPAWAAPPGKSLALVSRHRSDVVGCAQPSERSARRIAQPIPGVLASDATPRCASMASADRQMIGDATPALASPGQGLRMTGAGPPRPRPEPARRQVRKRGNIALQRCGVQSTARPHSGAGQAHTGRCRGAAGSPSRHALVPVRRRPGWNQRTPQSYCASDEPTGTPGHAGSARATPAPLRTPPWAMPAACSPAGGASGPSPVPAGRCQAGLRPPAHGWPARSGRCKDPRLAICQAQRPRTPSSLAPMKWQQPPDP
ncbi:hypothetical protein Veis_2843 [Verminephrobacter eiseniae EF01-2]|uniref:Uncharacterized protein n=1 Tax=Verminephrobacter eiseniae (strain EF01-2) TaxID=391735 RepID=A1WLS3_VEREI|nr:hypothetical protein Veis_2843 [Verminephrobacter eiseniae EF01-2]